jgi:hypothetical protein
MSGQWTEECASELKRLIARAVSESDERKREQLLTSADEYAERLRQSRSANDARGGNDMGVQGL